MICIVYFGRKVISILNLQFYLFFQHKAVILLYLQVVSAVVKQEVIHILCKLLMRTIYYPVDCGAISLKLQVFYFLLPFLRQPNQKAIHYQAISNSLPVPWHCEGNKPLFSEVILAAKAEVEAGTIETIQIVCSQLELVLHLYHFFVQE